VTPEPEYLPPIAPPVRESSGRGAQQDRESGRFGERDGYAESENYVVSSPEAPIFEPEPQQLGGHGYFAVPGFYNLGHRPERIRLTPNFGHAAIFFLLAFLLMATGEGLSIWMGKSLHLFGNASWTELATDARLSVPTQALEYSAIFGFSALLFGMLWHRPFLEGIHWNWRAARRYFYLLLAIGVAVGFAVGLGGDFLPMPKDAPIVQDMMNTAAGAWLMFFFSFTGAPLMEELAFRGFLMPSLINSFRWMNDRGWLPASAVNWIGVPFSILITSLCFAMLHGPQVSHSWGPILLIGVVSVVLCLVRLRLDSVLASAVVHGAYNLTLFAGMLVTTDAFRHLERLKN
jgi:membrane protease YdiL (CAAX protease family)